MLSIPSDLHRDPARSSIETSGFTVVDYVADAATVGLQVVVTQPTVVYIHEGLKELSSGPTAETIGAAPGSAVVMRSGTHLMSDLLPMSDRYRSTIVSIERKTLRALVGTVDETHEAPPAIVADIDPRVRQLADALPGRLLREHDDQAGHSLAVKELLVSTLLDRRLRQALAADLAGWSSAPHDRIRCVINKHRFEPLTVPQYASMCAMSVSTFKRRFEETYRASPGRWLIDTRLDHAAGLLASGEHPVTEICSMSGFGDLSNFIRAFNTRFGSSPTKYREQARSTEGAST